MRALAAVVTLALCSGSSLHALEAPQPPPAHNDRLARALLTSLGIADGSPAKKLLTCGRSLGFTKCLSALSLWRAENAVEALQSSRAAQFDLREDVERFPWEKYGNISEDQLYARLSEDTEKLLRYRSLALKVPGYSFELDSRGNGTLNVDVFKSDDSSAGRSSMKKFMKDFYNVIPILLLPGLIMSAILPFVLPMLKMTTVAVGMLNNMALSGAVFTLLRNNAFNDHYEKKIIYVNEGYKNEKYSPLYFKDFKHYKDIHLHDVDFAGSNVHEVVAPPDQPLDQNSKFQQGGFKGGEHMDAIQEAMNNDWINQYYGNAGFSSAGNDGFSDVSAGFNGAGFSNANPGFSNANSGFSVVSASPSSIVATATGTPHTQTKVRRSSKIKQSSG